MLISASFLRSKSLVNNDIFVSNAGVLKSFKCSYTFSVNPIDETFIKSNFPIVVSTEFPLIGRRINKSLIIVIAI